MARKARAAAAALAGQPGWPGLVLVDHDTKFVPEFDAAFAARGAAVKRVGPRAPNLNAYAERWVQTVTRECLDHFVVFGRAHLRHLITEYVEHDNGERPHQGVGNRPLSGPGPPAPAGRPVPPGDIECRERLGGLLKHCHRRAA